jgi:hypothetical protein
MEMKERGFGILGFRGTSRCNKGDEASGHDE